MSEKFNECVSHHLLMGNDDYTTIKIPKEFTSLIDEIIEGGKWGYQSRSEVVKAAVRDLYEKIQRLNDSSSA